MRVSDSIRYMIQQSNVTDFLPSTCTEGPTADPSEWLLARTKKRLERFGHKTMLKRLDSVEYTQVTISSQAVSETVMNMRYDLGRLYYEPHYLLMGFSQFSQLTGEADILFGGTYEAPMNLRHSQHGRLLGITILVVPGFDNLLLVPKEIFK